MTENEAIKFIGQAVIESGKALEALQNIKSKAERIGKVGEYYANLNNCIKEIEACRVAMIAIEEIQQYRAIGTVEEFKALKELNTPYKPQEYEDRYYACKCDNILLPKWRKYPTELIPKSEGLPHCIACGQKLDWSE